MTVIAPRGFANAGEQMYHFVPGIFDEPGFHTCNDNCPYPVLLAKGDRTGLTVTARHRRAESVRAARAADRRSLSWRDRLWEFFDNLLSTPR